MNEQTNELIELLERAAGDENYAERKLCGDLLECCVVHLHPGRMQ